MPPRPQPRPPAAARVPAAKAAPPAEVPISLTPNARRPDQGGVVGRKIRVITNFFAITKLEVDTVWHYDVTISPEIPAEKARKLWKVVEKLPEFAQAKMVYDGRANAYSSKDLKLEKFTKKVELPEPGPPAPNAKKNEFTVKINLANVIQLEELHRFLRREGPFTAGCQTALQALNVTMNHKLFNETTPVGRSAFSNKNAVDLGGGVEKWEGIFQSVRPGQGQLYANIDVASTAFYKSGNAAQLMVEVAKRRTIDDLRNLNKWDTQALQKHFKGSTFTVTHRGESHRRRYRVSEVSLKSADKITFEQETNAGRSVSVSIPQYYQKAYQLRLKHPFLPCFGVKGRDGTMYFPAEVCNIVPKRYPRRLDENQTTEMIRSTCLHPDKRAQKVREIHERLAFDKNEYMKAFGMEVSKDMTVVPARILPVPQVQYRGNVSVTPQFGGWQMNPARKMVQGSRLGSWGVLVYDREDRLDRAKVMAFLRLLTSTLQENGKGTRSSNPPIMYGQLGNVEKNIEAMVSSIQQKCNAPPELILVIMPNKSQTYSTIKTYCETIHRIGVMTQCALSKNIFRPNKQYCGNLGLKINAKLGGVNSTLAKDSIPFLTSKPTMIIGADVTHPAPGEIKPSVVAVVGSMDREGFRFAGRLKVQDPRLEVRIIDGLKFMIFQLLSQFHEKNRVWPERILFYRDGVSEGQFAEVMQKEVAAVKEACEHAKIKAKVTFCVVKKRHHARLFPMRPEEADRSGNCIAGTVVDSVITHPTEFDFYLQSHGGLQGTSRPTLYHVLLDEYGFKSDELQELTFRLCHVYARCTKSVSIVPAVYYAHLLAYRARHYQGGEFSDTASMASSGTPETFETSVR
ncbi:Piwi domain-containing protein [Mortierella sp. GBAus27b]|nr:Piwi domain-containing protein [Mortierella sp. GBAus27b]